MSEFCASKLTLPAIEVEIGYKTRMSKNVFFSEKDSPCCAAGVLYSHTQAAVASMSNGGFKFQASEHLISPPLQKNQAIFTPCVSFLVAANGNNVVNAAQNHVPGESTPAQMIVHHVASVQDILQQKTMVQDQIETQSQIEFKFRTLCTEEERLLALSRLQRIEQTMQQHGCRVITPDVAGEELNAHLQLRQKAHNRTLEEYMKLNNLKSASPTELNSKFKFVFSRCNTALKFIDSAQRHAMQENSVRTSACAQRCATAFVLSCAPLVVNWTVHAGHPLTSQNTSNQVLNQFEHNQTASAQEVLKMITKESVNSEISRYQSDSSIGVCQRDNRLFCQCTDTAGECQTYHNMYTAQAFCNQLVRNKTHNPMSLFSAASAADDCEGGACSNVNVFLFLQQNDKAKIEHDILQACQCIDAFTDNPDQTTSYTTHKHAFETMALKVKAYLQQNNIQLGVASLLAAGQKLDTDSAHAPSNDPVSVANFKTRWLHKMQGGDGAPPELGGHAVGFVNQYDRVLQVSSGDIINYVNKSGSTQEFLERSYLAEGTAPSIQLPVSMGSQQTTLTFGTNEILKTCNAQAVNAVEMLRKKYDQKTTPLIEALNVSEILTSAIKFSALSELPQVLPTNFFALGDAKANEKGKDFYKVMFMSGRHSYYTVDNEEQQITEGADLAGNLSDKQVISVENIMSQEEQRLCHLFDMTFHSHLIMPEQVLTLHRQSGIKPSALPALVKTKYADCSFSVARAAGQKRNAQVLSGADPLELQINLRFPEYSQARSLQDHAALVMARKLEIQKLFDDKEVKFQQGPYHNLVQVSISV